MVVSYQQHVKG